jgi:protocatechuate 3,4-dioxygenase, alpha subunit
VSTPSQTVGPFYSIGLVEDGQNELDPAGVALEGRLFDGRGDPVPDGLIEAWDAAGRRWGRSGTGPEGNFSFRVPADVTHLELFVFARGLLRHQWTRVYLGDRGDELLAALDPSESETLLARRQGDAWRFDIRLQGDNATVFFAH